MEDERGGPYVTAYSCVSSAECRRAGIALVLRPWWRQQAAAKWAGSRLSRLPPRAIASKWRLKWTDHQRSPRYPFRRFGRALAQRAAGNSLAAGRQSRPGLLPRRAHGCFPDRLTITARHGCLNFDRRCGQRTEWRQGAVGGRGRLQTGAVHKNRHNRPKLSRVLLAIDAAIPIEGQRKPRLIAEDGGLRRQHRQLRHIAQLKYPFTRTCRLAVRLPLNSNGTRAST